MEKLTPKSIAEVDKEIEANKTALEQNKKSIAEQIEVLESVGASKDQIEKLRKAAGLEPKSPEPAKISVPENVVIEKPEEIPTEEVTGKEAEEIRKMKRPIPEDVEPEKELLAEKPVQEKTTPEKKGKGRKEKMPNFVINDETIEKRTEQLIQQGYKSDTASKIAGLEEIVRVNAERKEWLEAHGEEKDREKRMASAKTSIEQNTIAIKKLLAEVKNPIKPEPAPEKDTTLPGKPEPKPEPEKDTTPPGKPEPEPEMLPPEKIEDLEKFLKDFENEKRKGLTSQVLKGFETYENWGKEGGTGRYVKMAVNLALIGAISMVSVKTLAEIGLASTTVLAGGVTSKIVNKVGFGMVFGITAQKIQKIVPEKYQKHMKWIVPLVMAGGTIGVSAIAGASGIGLIVGAASAGGMIASNLWLKNAFTGKNIEEKEKTAKEAILERIEQLKKTEGEIDQKKLKEIKNDFRKLQKKFERQKLFNKIGKAITKLSVASAVSTLTMTASSWTHGQETENPQNENQNNEEVNDKKPEETVKENEPLKWAGPDEPKPEELNTENKNEGELKWAEPDQPKPEELRVNDNGLVRAEFPKHDANFADVVKQAYGHEIQDQTGAEEPIEIKHTAEEMQNIIVHKGEGIEHAFIRQIEGNHELAKELGYEGDLNDTKALHEFAGREAHVIAIKTGYVDNAGHEVRVAEADKIGYEIKIENGHPVVHEESVDGKVIETHHEGDKFEENADKGEYVKNPEVKIIEDTNIQEEPLGANGQGEIKIEEEPLGTSGQEDTNIQEEPLGTTGQENKTPDETPGKENESLNTFPGEKEVSMMDANNNPESTTEGQEMSLDPKILEEANEVYGKNISQMFPDIKSMHAWERIKDSHDDFSAYKLIERPMEETNETFQPLLSQLQKIHEVTGLNPEKANIENGFVTESPNDFLVRGTIEAAKMGKLDDLKFYK